MKSDSEQLDSIHHIALSVNNIAEAVQWYGAHFRCKVAYQDETWALLKFDNISMALVVPHQHPPHIAFTSHEAAQFGDLKVHRDGTASVYVEDNQGNTIEVLDASSVKD